jgi:hypothetical protein
MDIKNKENESIDIERGSTGHRMGRIDGGEHG